MVVGGTVEGRADSSQAAVEGHVAVVHLGARRWAAAASVGMERERASQDSCCCPPLRKERSASREGAVRALQRMEGNDVLSMIDYTAMRYATSDRCAFTLRYGWLMLAVANESCWRQSVISKIEGRGEEVTCKSTRFGDGDLDSRLRWRLALPG